MNSEWQISSSTTKAGQEFHDWLNTGRMSSITQNFESNNDLLDFTSGKSLDSYFVDWLWEEQKKTFMSLMLYLNFSYINEVQMIHTLTSSAGQAGFSTQYLATRVP